MVPVVPIAPIVPVAPVVATGKAKAYDSTIGTMGRIDGNSLEGVSATTLWTLHNRGTEAKRSDGVIHDPWAASLFDAIEYDYRKFGKPNQSHALRARAFDAAATDYLKAHPKASVVALAEGLQSSFWRLAQAGVTDELTWYSIDLEPVMELRKQLLPRHEQIVELAQSALDRSWMDQIETSEGLFITAEGLLMYLEPKDSLGLIADCAARFPGAQFMFDSIPHWFSRKTLTGMRLSDRYNAPAMPFALTADEALTLSERIGGVHSARDIKLPTGRGLWRLAGLSALDRIGAIRRSRPSITLLEFAPAK